MSDLRRITEGRVVSAGGAPKPKDLPTDGRIEPTDDEKRNGWTAESLARYQAERLEAQSAVIRNDVDPRTGRSARGRGMPSAANSRYSPFRWRG